jgi:hypothetical protein
LDNFEEFIKSKANEKSLLAGTLTRSRQFIRAYINEKYDSYLIITLTTSSKDIRPISTNLKLSFISLNGEKCITKYINIKLNGVFFENLRNFLTKEELDILGESFSIYLRDTNFKVVSLILLQNRESKDIGMDHFVGA